MASIKNELKWLTWLHFLLQNFLLSSETFSELFLRISCYFKEFSEIIQKIHGKLALFFPSLEWNAVQSLFPVFCDEPCDSLLSSSSSWSWSCPPSSSPESSSDSEISQEFSGNFQWNFGENANNVTKFSIAHCFLIFRAKNIFEEFKIMKWNLSYFFSMIFLIWNENIQKISHHLPLLFWRELEFSLVPLLQLSLAVVYSPF